MRGVFLTGLAVLALAGCGSPPAETGDAPSTGPSEAELAAAQLREQQRQCVTTAMVAISGEPRDNMSVLSRINSTDITACPGDFAAAFVGLRQKFDDAVAFDREMAAHQGAGEDAVVGGVAVSFAEWLFETDSGITPFGDWAARDADMKLRAEAIARELRAEFQSVERAAASQGIDLSGGAKTVSVVLIRGEDLQGAPIFAFVGIPNNQLAAFMSAQRSGQTIYPEQYGSVILSGSGEPTEGNYQQMARDYNFNRDGMTSFN